MELWVLECNTLGTSNRIFPFATDTKRNKQTNKNNLYKYK